jgi:hypothetical protein
LRENQIQGAFSSSVNVQVLESEVVNNMSSSFS